MNIRDKLFFRKNNSAYLATDTKYNIDVFKIKDSMISAHGWVFHPEKIIESISLEVRDAENLFVDNLQIKYGIYRPDVEDHFVNIKLCRNSGFQIFRAFKTDKPSNNLLFFLKIKFSGHEEEAIQLPHSFVIDEKKQNIFLFLKRSFFEVFSSRRKIIHFILNNKISIILSKLLVFLKRGKNLYFNSSIDIKKRELNKLVLFIDHAMGGGANFYSTNFMNSIKSDYFHLSYDISSMSYMINIYSKNGNKIFFLIHLPL